MVRIRFLFYVFVILCLAYSYITIFFVLHIGEYTKTIIEKGDLSPATDHPDILKDSRRTETNTSEHCWRACPQRINKIYFRFRRAGLGDRLTIIENLAQIAGYLCAIVETPPPHDQLAPKHNNGNLVSKKLKWLDFRNLTFLQDGSQAVRDLDISNGDSDDWETWPVYNEEDFPGWLHIISDSKNRLLGDFIRLQEFSLLQGSDARTGFIWEIRARIYESNLFDQLLPPPSVQVQDLSGYEGQMLPELPTYYYFHPKEKKKKNQRCTYTNNNPMQLQPTSMVSLELLLERHCLFSLLLFQ